MRARLFSALELPIELRAQLDDVLMRFRESTPRRSVRWVRSQNIHVTLRFYGDVGADLVPELETGLARAAQIAEPIALTVQGLGVFPNPARPQVIWVGLRGDPDPLLRLAAAVEREATALGFPPEAREYTPHLTLGRVRPQLSVEHHHRVLKFLEQADVQALGEFRPEHMSLMASELRPGGSVDKRLFSTPLAQKEKTTGTD